MHSTTVPLPSVLYVHLLYCLYTSKWFCSLCFSFRFSCNEFTRLAAFIVLFNWPQLWPALFYGYSPRISLDHFLTVSCRPDSRRFLLLLLMRCFYYCSRSTHRWSLWLLSETIGSKSFLRQLTRIPQHILCLPISLCPFTVVAFPIPGYYSPARPTSRTNRSLVQLP